MLFVTVISVPLSLRPPSSWIPQTPRRDAGSDARIPTRSTATTAAVPPAALVASTTSPGSTGRPDETRDCGGVRAAAVRKRSPCPKEGQQEHRSSGAGSFAFRDARRETHPAGLSLHESNRH